MALKVPVNYRLHIMAKKELFCNKVFDWVLRKLGAFPVDRGEGDIEAVKNAMKAIKSGDNLLIFPEGTTIRNGIGKTDGLPAQAHSGAAVIGVRTGAILVPVFVEGEKRTLPPDTHHLRPALHAGIYRPPGDCGGDAEDRGRASAGGLRLGRAAGRRCAAVQVILAESAGFCYGVKRAVELAQKTAEETQRLLDAGRPDPQHPCGRGPGGPGRPENRPP